MKVTSITLQADNTVRPGVVSPPIELSFRDPTRKNAYNVKSITGLDGSDGITQSFYLNSSNLPSGTPQGIFYNMKMPARDIVFAITLNPNFGSSSYSDLRDAIYKMISFSRNGIVNVAFNNGNTAVAAIVGYITKLEIDHFAKDPTVNLTLNAPDPMLRQPTQETIDNPGSLNPNNFSFTDPYSTAPHGFDLAINVLTATPTLQITDPSEATPSWSFTVVPNVFTSAGGPGFLAGDIIYLSTDPSNRSISFWRTGVFPSDPTETSPIADAIQAGSLWPIMFPGVNSLHLSPPQNFSVRSIDYYPTYWGV